MGSDEGHFNVSLIVKDKVTRLSTDHSPRAVLTYVFLLVAWPDYSVVNVLLYMKYILFKPREGTAEVKSSWDPSAYQPNALPLGQTKL